MAREKLENWSAIRRRMIGETEAFLRDGLEHPERHVRIPRKEVGSGGFPRGFAAWFWSRVLNREQE